MVKLLHTADVHLGARFRVLGEEKGRAQRTQLQMTFERIGELALSERVDALVVAGDLFDSNSPSQRSIDVVASVFAKLAQAGVRVLVIPGTHDFYGPASVWRDFTVPGSDGLLSVFGDETEPVIVPELDVTFYGLVFPSKKAPAGALQRLRRTTDTRYHVGIVHGALAIPDIVEDESLLFTREEAASTGMDYLALGHWHSYKEERFGDVVGCYSGSPELVSVDQKGAGRVALVTIDADGVRVEAQVVGTRRFESLEIAMDAITSASQIADRIRARADQNLALDVTLTGLCAFDFELDTKALVDEVSEGFFHVRVRDKSHPRLDDVSLCELPETTVSGKFARIMTARIEAAPDSERPIYEEALRLGVAKLEGKQVSL